MSLRFLSLYSGVGLHDLGFERAGIRIAGQIEWDAYCRAVLEQHWPGLPRWSDVRDVTVDAVRERCGRIDGITAGFSCRNISVAGGQAGIGKETESGITWRNLFRLIRGLRTPWLVIENVPALRTLAADRVLAALELSGYACWPVVVGAEHLGAPHRRHRVWIIGCLADANVGGWPVGTGTLGYINGRAESSHGYDMADAARDGERESSETQRPDGLRTRQASDVALADASESRLAGRWRLPGGAGAEVAMSAGGGGYRWPSRPGEPQYGWEAPRLVDAADWATGRREQQPKDGGAEGDSARGNDARAQSGLGDATPGRSRRLAGFARRHALKALGNGNPPACAELIARGVLHLHQLVEASHASPGGPGRSCPVPGEQKEKP